MTTLDGETVVLPVAAIEERVVALMRANDVEGVKKLLVKQDVMYSFETRLDKVGCTVGCEDQHPATDTPGYITAVEFVGGVYHARVLYRNKTSLTALVSNGTDAFPVPMGWLCGAHYVHFTGDSSATAEIAAAEKLTGIDRVVYAGIRTDMESKFGFTYCAACGKANRPSKHCVRCKRAGYCDAVCQRADWKYHKSVCVAAK